MYLFQNEQDDDIKLNMLNSINKIIKLDYDRFQKIIYF
jgi:hypothetical protein